MDQSPASPVVARPTPIATPRIWSTRSFWYIVFITIGIAITILWWDATGSQPLKTPGDSWNDAGRITGLLGTYAVLLQLLLLARVPWLEEAYGLEELSVLHKWNAYLAVGLLVAHAVFQTIGYQLAGSVDTISQLADFIVSYQGVLAAIVALGLFIAVLGASITIARRRLSYEMWYFVHLYSYVAVLLAFSHQLAVGLDFIGNPVFTWFWVALYVVVIGALIFYRFVRPIRLYRRHRFKVERVEKERSHVTSIYVRGDGIEHFEVHAGQFMFWRFLDLDRWWQAHPFSLSAAPNGRNLRLTVKNIGDFTASMEEIKPGTRVLIEGPFGKFTESSRMKPKALLVAGGVGITPIKALAEEMVARGVDICVLYRCRREAEVIFKNELDRLAELPHVRIEYLFNEKPGRGRTGNDWFKADSLQRLVTDARQREVYICGPTGLMNAVRDSLHTLGVEDQHVHTEVFRL